MATQGAIQLDVIINEKSISIEKKNIVNFSVERILGDAADKFTLELFDESAWKVESALKGKSMASITVQYSAATDLSKKTIIFSGIVLDYQVAFSGRSSMITLEGILAYVGEGSASYAFTKANIEWVGGVSTETGSDGYPIAVDGKNQSWINANLDNEDICAMLVNGIPYYNPGRIFKRIIHKYNGDNLGTNGQEQTSGYNATSNDIKQTTWNFFKSNGFSDAATAGIMGNIQAESNFIVDRLQSGGPAAGLFQWENYNTKSGRWLSLNNYAISRGKQWTDVQTQLEFALSEMNSVFSTYSGKGGTGTYSNGQAWGWPQKIDLNTFKNQTDVATATEMFERCFERASIPHMNNRKQYAQGYYNLYTNKTNTGVQLSSNETWGTGGDGEFILGQVDETMWVQNVPLQQTNETTSQYITKLAKYAVATPNDMSAAEVGLLLINNELNSIDTSNLSAGFKYTMNNSVHSFTKMDYTGTGAHKQKIVYGSKDSNVISFAISNVGQMVMTESNVDSETGEALFDTSSLDYLSAEEITQQAMGKTDSKETIYQNWWGLNAKKYRIDVKSSATNDSLLANVSYSWRRNSKLDYFS